MLELNWIYLFLWWLTKPCRPHKNDLGNINFFSFAAIDIPSGMPS
jgi:hypothetical protein